jgi:hypothetical protein
MNFNNFKIVGGIVLLNLFSCNFIKTNKEDKINNLQADATKINLIIPYESNQSKYTLKPGEEVLFEAKQDQYDYQLRLIKIHDDTIYCRFKILKNDSVVLYNSDTIIRVKNNSSSHEGKFKFQCNGPLYEKTENKKVIRVVIPEDDVKCVGYYLEDNSYPYSHISNASFPVLFRKGVEEPYKEYLHNCLYDFNLASHQLNIEPTDKLFKEIYKREHLKLLNLINFLDSNKFSYNYVKDTALLDESLYYELDSLAKFLIDKGLINRGFVSNTTIQRVNIDSIFQLRALVRFNDNGQLISTRFEKIMYGQVSSSECKYPIGFSPFSVMRNSVIKFNDKYLLVMKDDGFESVSHLLTIWHKEANFYYLDYILNKTVNVGIGGIKIEKIINIDYEKIMVVGTKSGGDGGEVWGSFWLGIITKPNYFDIIYEIGRSGDEFKNEYLNYKIVANDGLIYLTKGVKSDKNNIQTDSILLQDTIRYYDLIKKTYKISHNK